MPLTRTALQSTLLANLKKALAFSEIAVHVFNSLRAEKPDGWLSEDDMEDIIYEMAFVLEGLVPAGVIMQDVDYNGFECNGVVERYTCVALNVEGEMPAKISVTLDSDRKHAESPFDNLSCMVCEIDSIKLEYHPGCMSDDTGPTDTFATKVMHAFHEAALLRYEHFRM